MIYQFLTELTVLLHFAFLCFVIAGGLLTRRRRAVLVLHLLAVAWAVYVESAPGVICPLTSLENRFAEYAGAAGYEDGFVEHYLVPVIYPEGLTPAIQRLIALFVIVVNAAIYAFVWLRPLRDTGIPTQHGQAIAEQRTKHARRVVKP